MTQEILVEPKEQLAPFAIDDLPETIREAAGEMGWTQLMPVQERAIPYMVKGRDMIVQSRTGSGKTGAFLIPMLMRIDASAKHAQALILCPTRELARQVHGELQLLGKGMKVKSALVYGGVGYQEQLDALKGGAQVIVGTPGRVLDHINRGSMKLDRLAILTFDEADEMLSMGFYPDMKRIRRHIPEERTTWMFSATMPFRVQRLAEEFMKEPGFLSLSAGQETISTMEHRAYEAPTMQKDQILMRLIEMEQPDSAIIFCNMKRDVEYVAQVLKTRNYNAEMISGDLRQNQREKVMQGIREGRYRFLVATDVAARGIDISDLSHVFLYDLPKDPELYVHRAGRTARAGNTGVAISLVGDMSERTTLNKIARTYKIGFVELDVPTDEQVVDRIGERLVIWLENRHRDLEEVEHDEVDNILEEFDELIEEEGGREMIAMLLDDVYRERFLAVRADQERGSVAHRSRSDDTEARFGSDEECAKLFDALRARHADLRPVDLRKVRRLLPVVDELLESDDEVILLAMLLVDSADGLLRPKGKKKRPKSNTESNGSDDQASEDSAQKSGRNRRRRR